MRRCLSFSTVLALSFCAALPARGLNGKSGPSSFMQELTCGNGGRAAPLSASRVRKGDRAYIEFRTRLLPGSPSGQMYIVFGELDGNGRPLSRYQTGLMPEGWIVGFYGGTLGAWRVSVSDAQYAAIVRKARASLARPPLWSMFGYNCNHFAAGFGDLAGLKRPKSPALPSVSFLPAYIEANR